MRSFLFFIIAILFVNVSFGQLVVDEIILPRYVQGLETLPSAKVPYVCRLTIRGLDPNKTYGYYSRFVSDPDQANTSIGSGFPILIKPTGFKRVTSVTVNPKNANA